MHQVKDTIYSTGMKRFVLFWSYSSADLKISLFVLIHIKAIPWKFCIITPKNSGVIFP